MVDLVMMTCARLELTVSTAGCGRLFRAAQPARKWGLFGGPTQAGAVAKGLNPWDSKAPCQFCPIGARNAGAAVAPMARAVSEIRRICPRCERPSSRLIEGNRCVSCYNRHREAGIGRNRRGTRPALADLLHTQSIMVSEGAAASLRSLPRMASRVEAMVSLAKAATGAMTFGVAPLVLRRERVSGAAAAA